MPSIAECLQGILDVAPYYSQNATPSMQARDQLSKDLRTELRRYLAEAPRPIATAGAELNVALGGRQATYSPLAWVRIFSPQYSPNATAGIYLVYLFAADGSRVYLSLNQGSSEIRSGHMRPVSSPQLLQARAAEARSAVRSLIESPLAVGAKMSINLGLANFWSVGSYSKRRMRNYEYANILAISYESGEIPADNQLTIDLDRMLSFLGMLYGDPALLSYAGRQIPADQISPYFGWGQGQLMDAIVRRAIEVWAEDSAAKYFESHGWAVKRVGPLKLGYDLECTKALDQVLHVEVKGTQTLGEEVFLTRNEERHNRPQTECHADHALYVLSRIRVIRDTEVQCSGGTFNCIWPWSVDPAALTPTEYVYRVPTARDPG